MRISDWSSDVCSSDLTKGLSGHSLGAASVHEAIYCLLMLGGGFMAGSANIAELDPRAEGFPVLRETRDAQLRTVMSNSFGFGGTHGTLVFARARSEERRVGKAGGSTGRTRGAP